MRLKERDDNWNANGVKRRDFRHSADGPEALPSRKKRTNKKWCKKKVGREHKFVKGHISFISGGYFSWENRDEWRTFFKCSDCGATKIESVFRELPVD